MDFNIKNIGILCLLLFLSCNKEVDPGTMQIQETLREVATFPVGNIYRTNGRDFYNWSYPDKDEMFGKTGWPVRDQYLPPKRQAILDTEFSSITPESCLKMHTVSLGPDTYDFTDADKMVQYAKAHHMRIHGHVLIWPSSVPEWIRHVTWTEQQYEDWLEIYIKTVVGRYKEDILAWDVVNEPLLPFFGTTLKDKKDNFWLYHLGDDYIEKAFKWAEEANPAALLFLNEVGAESSGAGARRKSVIQLANDLRAKGAKVDGLGFQFHLLGANMTDNLMESLITDVVDNDYLLHISEFDIQMNFPVGDKVKLSEEDIKNLKTAYNTVVYNYQKLVPHDKQHGITFWGISDINSFCTIYLNLRFNPNSEDFPHLWDFDFNKKQAYYGVMDGLKGIKGDY